MAKEGRLAAPAIKPCLLYTSGVQSARDTQLRTLGRPHTAKQARAAFAAARHAGFTNISGDIMLALPRYTEAAVSYTHLKQDQHDGCGINGVQHRSGQPDDGSKAEVRYQHTGHRCV